MAYLHKINFDPTDFPVSPHARLFEYSSKGKVIKVDVILKDSGSSMMDFSRAVGDSNTTRIIGLSGDMYEMDVSVEGDDINPTIKFDLKDMRIDKIDRTYRMPILDSYQVAMDAEEKWTKEADRLYEVTGATSERISLTCDEAEKNANIQYLRDKVFCGEIQADADFWEDLHNVLSVVLMPVDVRLQFAENDMSRPLFFVTSRLEPDVPG